MIAAQAVRPASVHSAPPLAWPGIGARGSVFGTSLETQSDVRALQLLGSKLRVQRGNTIFNEGDPAVNAYKVVSGTVRVCKHLSDGRRQIVQFAFAGDFVSVMESGDHSFTAEAVSDVVLTSYPQRQIDRLVAESSSIRQRFMTLMSHRLCEMQDHLMVLGRQTAKERVASFLLMLFNRTGFEADDVLDVSIGRQDIADYLGLTIETVCRTLSELKRSGIIDIPNQRQLCLCDVETLQSLAAGED